MTLRLFRGLRWTADLVLSKIKFALKHVFVGVLTAVILVVNLIAILLIQAFTDLSLVNFGIKRPNMYMSLILHLSSVIFLIYLVERGGVLRQTLSKAPSWVWDHMNNQSREGLSISDRLLLDYKREKYVSYSIASFYSLYGITLGVILFTLAYTREFQFGLSGGLFIVIGILIGSLGPSLAKPRVSTGIKEEAEKEMLELASKHIESVLLVFGAIFQVFAAADLTLGIFGNVLYTGFALVLMFGGTIGSYLWLSSQFINSTHEADDSV